MDKEEEEEINDVTDKLYHNFGSSSGHLFGIPPRLSSSVKAIVKVILRVKKK